MERQLARRRFSAHVEQLEDRRYMTADPVTDIGLGLSLMSADEELPPLEQMVTAAPATPGDTATAPADGYGDGVEQMLYSAHFTTGWYDVRSNYGFTGKGQTVAIIDSGLAWDHTALGGGFGAGYRVVGGWDYAENDSNPYDDGGAGGHGTHVAGIIGNSSADNPGVATGVDFVSLRVFNDAGQGGYWTYLENALKWIHLHRNDFANPITTVNMSLGQSNWNSSTIPGGVPIEDELAQLKADGIFIAVAAGNGYGSSFTTPGLSYPAASQYVVPVMSNDDSGSLSYFSQRLGRAIAAPGSNIASTIPDWKAGLIAGAANNGNKSDDFGAMGGTSMAAPYVAGASALIRQAMQFVGMTGVNEDTIYNHMMATADTIVDAASGLSYKKLNIGRAIDALMPTDDFGSTLATAQNLGTLSANQSVNGAIAKLGDVDMFKFTAGATGMVTFNATTLQQSMAPTWQVYNSSGSLVASGANSSINFSVTQGQSYTVSVGSSGGLGHYGLTISSTGGGGFTSTDWGVVAFGTQSNVAATGQSWYKLTASQAGYLTAQGAFTAAAGNVTLDLYDVNLNLLSSGTTSAGLAKVSAVAASGGQYFLRVSGVNSDVDFTLCNLVSQSGATVTVGGTSGNDQFQFAAGTSAHSVTINGVSYSFTAAQVNTVNFNGGAGTDSVVLSGTTAVDTATLRYGTSSLVSSTYSATVTGVENVTVNSGGGADQANIYDSAGDDVYSAYKTTAVMVSSTGTLTAVSFAKTTAYATGGGYDVAHVYDSTGDDVYDAYATGVYMSGTGFNNAALAFDVAIGYASTGNDKAYSHDTAGNDIYDLYWNRAVMYGAGYATHAVGFDLTVGTATTGNDHAYLTDSAGNDVLDTYSDRLTMSGAGYQNQAVNFDFTYARSTTGGADQAYMHDSAGNDVFDALPTRVTMRGAGYSNNAVNFEVAVGYASTGMDHAYIYDSAGDDVVTTWTNAAEMTGAGFDNTAQFFDATFAFATAGGTDIAYAYDSTGDDILQAWSNKDVLYGTGFFNYFEAFDQFYASASTGTDRAYLYDTTGDDLYRAWSNRATMSGVGYYNYAEFFDQTYGLSSGGADTAYLYDSTGNDVLQEWSDRAVLYGSSFWNYAEHFANVYGVSSSGGNDAAYLYDSSGDDSYFGQGLLARMSGATYRNEAQGFGYTQANFTSGNDELEFEDTVGNDLLGLATWGAYVRGTNYRNDVRGFQRLSANSSNGGDDAKEVETVDYLYALLGAWS